jgi:DNA-binding GntR family transcriptional regulator
MRCPHCACAAKHAGSRIEPKDVSTRCHGVRRCAQATPKYESQYREIRRSLLSGRYFPGQHLEPAALASDLGSSPTPVKFALHRLVGEGLLIIHDWHGFQVPLPTELQLRGQYDWMEQMLILAISLATTITAHARQRPAAFSADDDLPKHTWKLFDAMARASGLAPLHLDFRRSNDRLAPIRRAKQGLIEQATEEIAELTQLWQARRIAPLQTALHAYFARRQQLVPRIVATLAERNNPRV